MTRATIAITGATGGVGARVAARLADRGIAQRLVVREGAHRPPPPGAEVAVVPGYHDRDAMAHALRSSGTLLLVPARESETRVRDHLAAVDAAVAAGVERIVYASLVGAHPDATFTFAHDHWVTEQHVRAAGLGFTILRSSVHTDSLPGLASAQGVIAGPAGEGRVGAVTRDDVATATAAVLLDPRHDGKAYALTGPEALSLADVAQQLAEAAGRPVDFRNETLSEAYASRASPGASDGEIDGLITCYAAIATGEMDLVTDAIPRLTGHRAQSLREFLAAHPEAIAHLRR